MPIRRRGPRWRPAGAAGLAPLHDGQVAEALAAYRLARADPGGAGRRARSLQRRPPRPGDHHQPSASCCEHTGKPAEAEAEYRKALAIQQKLADDNPALTEFRTSLAGSHNNLGYGCRDGQAGGGGGRVPQGAGDPAEAGRRQPRRHRLPQRAGEQPQQPRPRAVETRASRRRRRPSSARRLAIQQKLADDNPAVTEFRFALANSHGTSACCCRDMGKPAEAEAEHRKAMELHQKLADDNPAVTDFRSNLALSHSNLGLSAVEHGQAGGGGGRVPQGAGDLTEAGRRQPRRHRIPQQPGG